MHHTAASRCFINKARFSFFNDVPLEDKLKYTALSFKSAIHHAESPGLGGAFLKGNELAAGLGQGVTQRPQRGWERRRFWESLEEGDAGAATLRWPLATRLRIWWVRRGWLCQLAELTDCHRIILFYHQA